MQRIIDHGSWDAAMKEEEEDKSLIPGIRKVKGISKLVTRQEMTIDNYRDVMSGFQPQRHTMNVIRSRDHVINIERQEKISLSILENKRLVSKAVMSNWLICISFLIIEKKKIFSSFFFSFLFFFPCSDFGLIVSNQLHTGILCAAKFWLWMKPNVPKAYWSRTTTVNTKSKKTEKSLMNNLFVCLSFRHLSFLFFFLSICLEKEIFLLVFHVWYFYQWW